MHPLLDEETLRLSSVVANCRMNRERRLIGTNSYSVDLKLDVIQKLMSFGSDGPVRWLDVCCGSAIALIQAVEHFQSDPDSPGLFVDGIDLVGHFVRHDLSPELSLRKTSFENWTPKHRYDLVTCVHGLHYIGDKLSAIRKMVNCLSERGTFVANVDLENFRFADGSSASAAILTLFREQGITFDKRSRLIERSDGRKMDSFAFSYLGADDNAGPNYTGQPAVNSHYDA